ncbi:MAG: hypothetical protein IKI45_14855 [Oscillospiraceae bacterium]|nr:hypothetical protein [Oscillospiraceae bacterium]
MKHADKKKLTSMLCVSVLSVSSFFGCAYGPAPDESLVENYSLDLSAFAETAENTTETELPPQM